MIVLLSAIRLKKFKSLLMFTFSSHWVIIKSVTFAAAESHRNPVYWRVLSTCSLLRPFAVEIANELFSNNTIIMNSQEAKQPTGRPMTSPANVINTLLAEMGAIRQETIESRDVKYNPKSGIGKDVSTIIGRIENVLIIILVFTVYSPT